MDLNTVLTFEAICKVYINYFVPFEICSISTVIVIVVTVISFTLCILVGHSPLGLFRTNIIKLIN